MRALVLLFTMALLSPAFANGVTQGFVTAEDVVKLFDNGVAIEVEVPEGAATYTLYYGPNGYDNGLSSRLNQHPSSPATQLRILAFLPDPATVNPCAAEEAQARIVIIPKNGDQELGHSRQDVCVPHPEKPSITGSIYQVGEGNAPELQEWTPLLLHAWRVHVNTDPDGYATSETDLDHVFLMQVYFGDREGDFSRAAPALGLDEFLESPRFPRITSSLDNS